MLDPKGNPHMSMEENKNTEELQEHTAPADPSSETQATLTEEEKREILSVFAETNENKRRRSGFKMTIRNQIILVGVVLALAAVLLGAYYLFLKEPAPLPAFYAIDEQTGTVLDALDTKVTVTFCNRGKNDLTEESDPDVYRIYTYATLYRERNGDVKIKFDTGDTFNGVRIEANGKTLEYKYGDFYVARPIDDKVYGFAGETIFTDAILELTGKEKLALSVRPLDGYDKEGNDVLPSGGVVMFPMVDRSDISMVQVKNEHGEFVVYQGDNDTFYFSGCELLTYNAEQLASLLVDCRYVVTSGKLEDQLDYSVYGLDKEESLTCRYTLLTMPEKDGTFDFHQVWVGKKAASGSYYYAMYFGGRMDEDNNVLENYANKRIFLMPYGNVEGNLTQPVEKFFDAQLVNSITDVNQVYEIGKVAIDYYYYDDNKEDVSAVILNLPVLDFSSNATSNNSTVTDILKDKITYASTGRTYSDWTEIAEDTSKVTDGTYLAGLSSTDGNAFTVQAAVTNIASDGKYTCTFGLLKDEDNKKYAALMPDEVTIRYSSDGTNYKKFTDFDFDFDGQKEDTVVQYSFTIESDEPVLLVELSFEMPNKIGYLVMDEIGIRADGEDAVPNDALTGLWRLVAPSSFVPEGKNYTYLDSTNFAEFLNSMAALMGDSVAKVGICERSEDKGDDVIHTEMLAEYGLDKPMMHYSYEYSGFVTDLYVSAYDEENACYYVYSTITGDVYDTGDEVTVCTGLIARISKTTAPWIEWELTEFVDHTLVGMYVYEIKELEVEFEGKTYLFEVTADGKTITSVCYGDTELDEENFRYLYLSIVQLYMRDEYVPSEGETPEEYLRIRIKTTTDEKEYVFYRVSASRAYYTVDGSGGYYCRIRDLRNVTTKLAQFIAGEKVER